jgi:hypothetical protein
MFVISAASRLGRRPKRLKAHYSAEAKNTLPAKQVTIAPQPLFASKLPLSMAELEVKTLLYCFVDRRL